MATLTLEELKAQNAAEEEVQQEEAAADEVEAEDTEEVESTKEVAESDEEAETEEEEVEEVEAWLQVEDESEEGDGQSVPLSKHIDVTTKLKGNLREKESEIDALKAEIEKLKTQPAAQSIDIGKRPNREDFYEHDDPDGAYEDALYEWRSKSERIAQQAKAREESERQQMEQLKESVNSHYQRAEKLIEKHGIDASVYQQADRKVRQAIDAASGNGDVITDALIGQIGDGSEKLMLYVGSNSQRLEALKSSFQTDPSGLKAMRLVGRWEAEAIMPKKKITRAAKPAKRADGGTDTPAGAEAKFKKQYLAAHSKGDFNSSIKIREKAKAAGFNPKNW